jgi:putative transposase/transposase-like zinc-binding protein
MLLCRTRALGGELFASENAQLIVYHTCKSRACPGCGRWATRKWVAAREAALPRGPYKGITFTMPDVLWRVFCENRSLVDALPSLAANAITALVLARHGLQAGIIAVLHTFNGRLEFNSHVHTMVTAGGRQLSSGKWIRSVYYDRDLLTDLWRTAVLKLLRTALRSGLLTTKLTRDEAEAMLVEQERWWSVKIQSVNSTEHLLQYSGRYVRRPPIAQYRIIHIGNKMIRFLSKDKVLKRFVVAECTLEEFIDRWAQHIPRTNQHLVRNFGLFSPRGVNQTSDEAIGQQRPPKALVPRWADSLKQTFGRDPLLDQHGRRMFWVRQLAAHSELAL